MAASGNDDSEKDKKPAEAGNGKKPVPKDAVDISSLWLDTGAGDPLATTHLHEIPRAKPKDFFRVHPDPAYRRVCVVYTPKSDDAIDPPTYVVMPSMHGILDEERKAIIATVVYRNGSVRLWILPLPKDGGRDVEAWSSARNAARTAMAKWVKLVWKGRAYITRDAQPGYAPDPDWSKLPTFDELIRIAFGDDIITNEDQAVVRDALGAPPEGNSDDPLA